MKNIEDVLGIINFDMERNQNIKNTINDLNEIISEPKITADVGHIRCALRTLIIEHNQLLARAAVQLDLLLKLYEKLEEKEGE